MSNNLFIAELMFIIVCGISFMLSYEFYLANNGPLKRLKLLLVLYFASQGWAVFLSGVYSLYSEKHISFIVSFEITRIVAITPTTICMILIYIYIRNQKL
jgi:hypothetical protein